MSDALESEDSLSRAVLPDLVRAFALFGIAVVNVGYLAYPGGNYSLYGELSSGFDKAAFLTVNAFFLMKSYTLFSFMFGVGFAYQIASARRNAHSFTASYWRRITGLLVLGILHVILFYQGDILIYYALFGAILYLFRNLPPERLNRWAVGLYLGQLFLTGLAVIVVSLTGDPEPKPDAVRVIFSEGSFSETVVQRIRDWSNFLLVGIVLQALNILAFFLLGLSAVKSGIIHDAAHPIWRKCRRLALPVGVLGSVVAAWIMISSPVFWNTQMVFGLFLILLFAPFSTAGYLGLLAKLAEGRRGKAQTFFARGGTASLTAYLMQGLLMSLIFNGYGLGLYATLGAAWCIIIGATVALISITFVSLWRAKFARGPMEYLFRRWTYRL